MLVMERLGCLHDVRRRAMSSKIAHLYRLGIRDDALEPISDRLQITIFHKCVVVCARREPSQSAFTTNSCGVQTLHVRAWYNFILPFANESVTQRDTTTHLLAQDE